ncbi:MAG: hypothetical protein II282_02235 [Alistipes sp.]|nr:hypothetical protein [Alistipes sp.]
MVIVFLGGLVVGVWLSPRDKTITTRTTVDTVVYYRPLPITSHIAEVRTLSMPRLLFAPADTVQTTTVIVKGDSVELQVPIERREYRDSTYYAVVSGAVVGDIHPTLETIKTYNRNTIQTVQVKPRLIRPYVSGMLGKESAGGGGGLIIANRYGVGVNYIYAAERSHLMGEVTIIF